MSCAQDSCHTVLDSKVFFFQMSLLLLLPISKFFFQIRLAGQQILQCSKQKKTVLKFLPKIKKTEARITKINRETVPNHVCDSGRMKMETPLD